MGVAVQMVPAVSDALSRGTYDSDRGLISVVSGYDADSRCRTLVHELRHALDPASYIQRPNMAEREMVVDSVTFWIVHELGLDVTDCKRVWNSVLTDSKRAQLLAEAHSIANQLYNAIGLGLDEQAS
jgi:hypothetical protein